MLKPSEKDLTIYVGATYVKVFKLQYKDTGNPLDVSGWTARMQIRKKHDSPESLIDLTTENGGLLYEMDSGPHTETKLTIKMTPAQTDTFEGMRSAKYDIEVIDDADNVGRIIEGTITFSPQVTRTET